MNWALSLLATFISGSVGLFTSGVVANAYAKWYHLPTREGAAGFFVIEMAMLGGIACGILGLIITRTVATGPEPALGKAVAFSSGGILLTGALGALVLYLFADHPPVEDRVQRELELRSDQDQFEARQAAAEQAAFDAIAPGAPVSEWLPYASEGQNEERRAIAIERITGRAGFVAELGGLMVDADARQAEAALRFVGQFPAPDAGMVTAVTAAGRDIIERIRKVNAAAVEDDPGYEGAADVAYRFSCWISAVRVLREKTQGDFIPELREILSLSRIRTDSHVMQQDVRRVASYYLEMWAGVEPRSDDPPPR